MSSGWKLHSGSAKQHPVEDMFKTAQLLNRKNEPVSSIQTLQGKIVLLLFAAKWAEPCAPFVELLRKFLKDANTEGRTAFQVIYISNDKTREEAQEFFQKEAMDDWIMVAHGPCLDDIAKKYDCKKIPEILCLNEQAEVIVQGRDIIIDLYTKARGEVPSEKIQEIANEWRKKSGDWRSSEGQSLGGASQPATADGVDDKEAKRRARLAALEARGL